MAMGFLLGAAIGSFLNVVADRLPAAQSIISPPSHCPECQRKLSAKDNIPIFSYLWLRGRCRYCGAAIPGRLLWVELGTAALFAFLYWHYGASWQLLPVAIYCCAFIVLLVIDLEQGVLPNKIVYPGIIIALIAAVFAEPGIKSASIGGATGFALLLIPALIFRGGMGWGDVKLAALIGLVTGFPNVLIAIYLALVSGGLVAVLLLVSGRKQRKDPIAFGPFLVLAAMVTLFWGDNIVGWVAGLLHL
jgi:prepilin signal peptidase PulO-like enzyme (type II secretory pathway)